MSTQHDDAREKLRSVRSFLQLLGFLRDELGWPIEADDFEDAFFEYSPEELGIEEASAAKITTIKRLRPLNASQPWGIYFVDFEPKRLPVVALRRILNSVVLKKRASANSAERAAWQRDDLLFISSWGDEETRHLSFAQFADESGRSGLPTLRVLGWDRLDTPLHLDKTAAVLRQHLRWPADEDDVEGWRRAWRSVFTLTHREVIRTARDLAERLAILAQEIRNRIRSLLEIETREGPLTQLMAAFRESLIHDLSTEDFADMYAQTITYGLLSARIARPSRGGDNLASEIPLTNPFLRELMETFLQAGGRNQGRHVTALDSDELGIDEVIELLDKADMSAVLRDFGDRNPDDDPVIHFYERFLKEYDPERRLRRGVFYTPRPVVRYIVQETDRFLRDELGLEDGLADTTTWGDLARRTADVRVLADDLKSEPVVKILDPATGTGTFLVEVIDVIFETLNAKWQAEGHSTTERQHLWNRYVPEHLLTRLYGYEVMMAPYAIAHVKLGLKLYETGYRFGSRERARVFLTNALEPADDPSDRLDYTVPALAHEAVAVNQVKDGVACSVVIGNPPYSDASQNLGPQFERLIQDFRYYLGDRIRERGAIRFEHAINNDYIKYWGLALEVLKSMPIGSACMITSNSFLDGKSFRGVRDSLLKASSAIRITDLHGEGWAGSLARAGVTDENVFEIQTGVAVTHVVITSDSQGSEDVSYREVIGPAESKSEALLAGLPDLNYQRTPRDERRYLSFLPAAGSSNDDYWDNPQLDSMFWESVDGIKTSRDGLVIANTFAECRDKILAFLHDRGTTSDIERRYKFKAKGLRLSHAQRHLSDNFDEDAIVRFAYRPFDMRYIYYDRELILSHRMNVMPRVLPEGAEAIVCASRLSAKGFEHAIGSRTLCSNKYSSHDINSRMFPTVLLREDLSGSRLRGNLRDEVLDDYGVDLGSDDVERCRRLGHYLLAVLSTPGYRERYMEEIQQDFPRVPRPATVELFADMAALGRRMMNAFCLDVEVPEDRLVFTGSIGETAGSPKYTAGRLRVGATSVIEGVSREAWEHRCAGYQVVKSWFTAGNRSGIARRDQPLTQDRVDELRRVLFALTEYLDCRVEADRIVEERGGWQAAFLTTP